MVRRKPIFVFLATLLTPLAVAGEPSPLDALRAKFPHGIPWNVEILDAAGKTNGKIEMLRQTQRVLVLVT